MLRFGHAIRFAETVRSIRVSQVRMRHRDLSRARHKGNVVDSEGSASCTLSDQDSTRRIARREDEPEDFVLEALLKRLAMHGLDHER